MLSYDVPPVLFHGERPMWFGLHNLSILGLRLIWAINKSGHLDQKVSK